jgi:exodeoxyribonuclease VII large subunit
VSHARPCSRWGLPSRPGCPDRWCALTAPFHPCLYGPWPAIGGLFSVALSCGSPRLAVSQHPALWSPDLPRPGPELSVLAATTRPAHRHLQSRTLEASVHTSGRYRGSMAGITQPSLLDDHADALSISALYDRIEIAIARAFPRRRSMWVRGEIQSVSDRTGHCYMDLVDPESTRDRQTPVLKVKCWRTSWQAIAANLARQGVVLEPGMVVVIRGTLDFYKPRAELGFLLSEVDVAAILGRLAQRRAALLELLKSEGLLERNRRLAVPQVPLRVGLVASPGTEGHSDFVGQLLASPYAFDVVLAAASVQGRQAPSSISGALVALARRGCDIAVVVRGGGSKADLAAFDTESVARAMAMMPIPVWVGIGHTGDQSVADIVANRSFVTPTECGQEIVGQVAAWWESVIRRARTITRRAHEALGDAQKRDETTRHRLLRCALQQLQRHEERVDICADRLARTAPRQLEGCATRLSSRAARIGSLASVDLDRQADRVASTRRLLAAYDLERQLERGYTLTLDDRGRLVRSARELTPGDMVSTRFADGSARSSVRHVDLRTEDDSNASGGTL